MANPREFKELDHGTAARVAAAFGADQIVIVTRKEGPGGGICITNAGLTQHDALVSRSIADEIRDVIFAREFEFEAESTSEIDKLAREAAKEMQEGPPDNPTLGKTLIKTEAMGKKRQ